MNDKMKQLALVLIAVFATVAVVACGGDEDEGTATPGISTVAATLSEWRVEVDPDSAAAGEVAFEAENAGTIPHELVVVKSDEEPGSLPVVDAKVDESQVDVVGEIEEFPAGETASGTFDLTAGNYILLCNIPTHYGQGMYLRFIVQ